MKLKSIFLEIRRLLQTLFGDKTIASDSYRHQLIRMPPTPTCTARPTLCSNNGLESPHWRGALIRTPVVHVVSIQIEISVFVVCLHNLMVMLHI